MVVFDLLSYVKMFLTREQFAWANSYDKSLSEIENKISPSETEKDISRWDSSSHKCEGSDYKFKQWFVGFTDGDGCFNVYINEKARKIIFTFKISQKNNNYKALYYIKKHIGVGSVTAEDKEGMIHYLLRNKTHLESVLLPIFDEHSLLTSKEYSYLLFKKCLEISNRSSLSIEEKIQKIKLEKSLTCPIDYLPSKWLGSSPITKDWVVGFTEAEGSFYISRKDATRMAHGFGITQKKDRIVLEGIIAHMKIKCNVRTSKYNHFAIDVSDKTSLKLVKDYFFSELKGIKSLDYRIWARSFSDKGNYEKLLKIQSLLRRVRANTKLIKFIYQTKE